MSDSYRRAIAINDIRESREQIAKSAMNFAFSARQMSQGINNLAAAMKAEAWQRRILHRTGEIDTVNIPMVPDDAPDT